MSCTYDLTLGVVCVFDFCECIVCCYVLLLNVGVFASFVFECICLVLS